MSPQQLIADKQQFGSQPGQPLALTTELRDQISREPAQLKSTDIASVRSKPSQGPSRKDSINTVESELVDPANDNRIKKLIKEQLDSLIKAKQLIDQENIQQLIQLQLKEKLSPQTHALARDAQARDTQARDTLAHDAQSRDTQSNTQEEEEEQQEEAARRQQLQQQGPSSLAPTLLQPTNAQRFSQFSGPFLLQQLPRESE